MSIPPGDCWLQCWQAVKRVRVSQWNDRAVFASQKARLEHSALSMAVLCQRVVDSATRICEPHQAAHLRYVFASRYASAGLC